MNKFQESLDRIKKNLPLHEDSWTDEDREHILTIIEVLEKQIPKKPDTLTYRPLLLSGWKYQCPNCGCAIGDNKNLSFAYGEYLEPYEDYCCGCGQALDWSDTE